MVDGLHFSNALVAPSHHKPNNNQWRTRPNRTSHQEQDPCETVAASFEPTQGYSSPLFEPQVSVNEHEPYNYAVSSASASCSQPCSNRYHPYNHSEESVNLEMFGGLGEFNDQDLQYVDDNDHHDMDIDSNQQDNSSLISPPDQQDYKSVDYVQPHPTQRYTYRDIHGVLRDIWQPGDPSGSRDGELIGATAPKTRFRFFQHDNGPIIRGRNSPPRYVILDDQAAYELLASRAYKPKELAKYWYHDFSQNGGVRNRRTNRGRAAIVEEGAGDRVSIGDNQGERIVGWAPHGKGKKYYFTGERNGYTAVQFEIPPIPSPDPEERTRNDKRSAPYEEPPCTPRHKRPKVNTYLHATPSPPWPKTDRRERQMGNKTPYGGKTTYGDQTAYGGHTAYGGQTTAYQGHGFIEDDDLTSPPRPNDVGFPNNGSKTVYAGFNPRNQAPDRVNGRITHRQYQKDIERGTVGHHTLYAYGGSTPLLPRTPYGMRSVHGDHDDTDQRGGIWESVKNMESELRAAQETIKGKDEEINTLKTELSRLKEVIPERAGSVLLDQSEDAEGNLGEQPSADRAGGEKEGSIVKSV